jgi:hypothetical protein
LPSLPSVVVPVGSSPVLPVPTPVLVPTPLSPPELVGVVPAPVLVPLVVTTPAVPPESVKQPPASTSPIAHTMVRIGSHHQINSRVGTTRKVQRIARGAGAGRLERVLSYLSHGTA